MRRLATRRLALPWILAFVIASGAEQAHAQSGTEELQRVIATLPAGLFDLSDLDLTTTGSGKTTATATITLLGARTDVLVSLNPGGGTRSYLVGLRPDDWSLAKAVPGLALPALEGLTLSNVGLVIAGDSLERTSEEMSGGEYDFYSELLKAEEFTLKLRPGINLFASIPVDKLPADHPLLGIINALGIEKGVIRIQGTLGRSLAMLADPAASGADAIKDLYLRAELPPMRPAGSPEWFRKGQLALEITGEPSMRLAGEMTVMIQQDELQFFLAASLAKAGVSLSGGLKADRGWEQPFGIEWLTLYKVVLKIGVTAVGSVQLGFGADLKIGEKDMAVAVAIAISPAGAPTNFIFEGESKAGFGISDLAALQAKMASARAAATGSAPVVAIPIDALPAVEFRDIGLKFAPKDEPDLGVQRGMSIKGKLLVGAGSGSALKEMASVDVSVGDDGFWVRGSLEAFQVGPLTWQDALLDLTATREIQRLRLSGDVSLLGARQKVDLDISKTQLRFNTVTELFGYFHARIDAYAVFNLQEPKFQLHAIAESDLGEVLQPIVRGGAIAFAAVTGVMINSCDVALIAIRQVLAKADATADELQAAIEAQRARARANLNTAQARATELTREANAARAVRDRAREIWEDTPFFPRDVKTTRRNAWLDAVARYAAAAAAQAGHAVFVNAARKILDALPPPDQSILVMTARAAADFVRSRLVTAERNLEALKTQHEAFVAAINQGGILLAINLAEVRAEFEGFRSGGSLAWRLAGTFVNKPFDLRASIDFSEPVAAAGEMLSQLIHR